MTGPDSPSVLLQRAADKLAELAEAAPQAPWRLAYDGDLLGYGPVAIVYSGYGDGEVQWAAGVTDWVKVMSPVVAAPLVAWLRMAAKEYESRAHLPKLGGPNPYGAPIDLTGSGLFGPSHWELALDLAKQVLGLSGKDMA